MSITKKKKFHKKPKKCIPKVFMKLRVKYKINPMHSEWDINIPKNFNQ